MAIPNIMGLVGPSGSGKSEVKKYLRKQHGFATLHAGKPVKKAMRAAFDLSKAATKDPDSKDAPNAQLGGASARDGMEAIGKAMEDSMPMALSTHMRKRVMKRLAKGKSVVVDGVRSPQQAATLKNMGGILVRVDNGKMPDSSKPMDQRQSLIKDINYVLDTSGDKKDLCSKVDGMLKDLMA